MNLYIFLNVGNVLGGIGKKTGGYTGIFKNNVLNVKKENDKIIFQGICDGNIEEIVRDYFDLDTNYEAIKEKLSKIDNYLKTSIEI